VVGEIRECRFSISHSKRFELNPNLTYYRFKVISFLFHFKNNFSFSRSASSFLVSLSLFICLSVYLSVYYIKMKLFPIYLFPLIVWTEELSFGDGQKISLEKFYKQLHAFVRRKLRNFYADQVKLD
jgi:hypothetical protein